MGGEKQHAMIQLDIHTHSIASGHDTTDTLTDLARAASARKLSLLAVTEHGPKTPGACRPSYYQSLFLMPRTRFGVRLLLGSEVNIVSFQGDTDLSDEIMNRLDFVIAGLHHPCLTPGTKEENTRALISVMERHPCIKLIAHPDDGRYPLDYPRLVQAAKREHVLLEVNERSLSPGAYRKNSRENLLEMLYYCKKEEHPVVMGSDSHGSRGVGLFPCAQSLLKEADFPEALVLNNSLGRFLSYIQE